MHHLRLKSHVVFHLLPEETCTTIRDTKVARVGCNTLANGWLLFDTSRARPVRARWGVRQCTDLGETDCRSRRRNPSHRRAESRMPSGVYCSAEIERHQNSRHGRIPNWPSALANGWPFSHTSRARTLGLCGGVRILVSDNLEDGAPRAVEGKQEPVQVEDKVVRHKTRKKHGLPSFTIRSLRRRCDRLGSEARLGESGSQLVKSRQNSCWTVSCSSRSWGVSPAIAVQ